MRRKLIAGFAAVTAAAVFQVVTPTEALACHKDKPHGSQVGVTVTPVQEEPIVCGKVKL